MPSVGSSSAQSNNSSASGNATDPAVGGNNDNTTTDDRVNNNTNRGGDVTDNNKNIDDLPIVNDTETSSADDDANIVINEVELNPRGSDWNQEWIELYNPVNIDTNLTNFEIRTSFKSATIQLPPEAMIEANGTYVIELDGLILSNTAESLVLANASGEIIDRTPSLVDRSDDERTWQRIPDGNDEWQFTAGTRDQLNDPGEQVGSMMTRSATSSSVVRCQGTAGCAEGMAIRIVDGDTLYVRVNSTIYKVDLALVSAPSRMDEGFIDSTAFTRSMCLGSNILIDQDDRQLTSDTSIIAVVYCESANLNSELLDNNYATLDVDQCQTSEFAGQRWAREHGC
jgi:endonuclease YncB( thermonuclease family)